MTRRKVGGDGRLRRDLAHIAEERGDQAEAEAYWRAVLAECPGHPEATRRLVARVA